MISHCCFNQHFSDDVEHGLMCLFAIHISSMVKYLFLSLAHFITVLFLNVLYSRCNSLSFILLIESITAQTFLNLLIFFFLDHAFDVMSKNSVPIRETKNMFLYECA